MKTRQGTKTDIQTNKRKQAFKQTKNKQTSLWYRFYIITHRPWDLDRTSLHTYPGV